MDKQEARDLLLSGFKPKEKDIATPYLTLPERTAPDGTVIPGKTLDGHLKLVGLSGKEYLAVRNQCTVQVPTGKTDQSGGDIYETEFDDAKLAGMCLIKCLYLRGSHEPLLSQTGDADLADIVGMDQDPFNKLGVEVLTFLGMKKNAVEDAKKNSEPTQNASSISNLPTDSTGSDPLTSSLPESPATNSQTGQPISA